MKAKFVGVLFYLSLAYFGRGEAQNGREIVQRLWENRDKCREPLGSNWIPLPDGLKCGALWCNYPKDWCAIRGKNGVPDLFCAALDGDCQSALKGDKKAVLKVVTKADRTEDDEDHVETTPLPTTRKPKTTTTPPPDDTEEETKPPKIKIPCEDFHDVCCFWAAGGECERNPTWMKRTCRKSCGVCSCAPSEVDLCQSHVVLDPTCRWIFPNGPPGTPARTRLLLPVPQAPLPTRPDGAPSIPGLPPVGQPGPLGGIPGLPVPIGQTRSPVGGAPGLPVRLTNPLGGQSVGQTSALISSGRANCQDRQPSCRFWASTGQCSANPRFMSVNCPASCGLC